MLPHTDWTGADTGDWGGYPGVNVLAERGGYYCSESGSFAGNVPTQVGKSNAVLLRLSALLSYT